MLSIGCWNTLYMHYDARLCIQYHYIRHTLWSMGQGPDLREAQAASLAPLPQHNCSS